METFGRYLTRQRELRGLTREDVVRATKLSAQAVEALEADRPEALPGRAFAVGWIRSYAACIGLDPDETVLRFEESAGTEEPAEARPRRRPLLVVALALLAVGAVAAAVAAAL